MTQPVWRGQQDRELPIRILDREAGPVIACLCGTEAAVMAPPGVSPQTVAAAADVSPVALLRMILHARQCVAGRNVAAGLYGAA